MKFTLSWLKDHLETDASVEAVAERLTMIGLEVEAVEDPVAVLAPFTVAEVVTAEQHPNADKLRLCGVRTGLEGEADLQIICGAPNARAGIKVVLARPGMIIPESGMVLKTGKIRGVESQGMMCSARELGLGEDHSGIIELPDDAPLGASLPDVMRFDPMIDIAITPNRPDCLGVRGVARDLAAAGLGRLKPLTVEPVPGTFDSPITVCHDSDADREACPMFVGRYIRGVRNGDSPQWVRDRLTAIGLRPISALVDVTNLIAYEFARPLHVFDADRLTGGIHPRLARPGETILALDEKEYTLTPEDVAICDEAGPQAIGGVMGGLDTGCTEGTVNVFLESALFDARRIAATGRRLGIDSDARYRFERGVDPEGAIVGAEAATRLILDWCGGEPSQLVIAGAPPAWRTEVPLDPLRVRALCGLDLSVAACRRILEDLGCEILSEDAEGVLTVLRPSWRPDISAEHDLVEEVARVHGFDRIPTVSLPRDPMPKQVLTGEQTRRVAARRALAGRGLSECVTWSFLPKAHAEAFGGGQPAMDLANPISSDLDAMRPSIVPNLATAAQRNADRGVPGAALFEVGPDFHGGEPGEQRMVAAGLRAGQSGTRHWDAPPRPVDAFDAKADALAALAAAGAPVDSLQTAAGEAPAWYHPGRSGALKLGPTVLAWFGELHPGVLKVLDVKGPVAAFEVVLNAVPEPKAKPTKSRPLLRASAFQPVERDFAFVVDEGVAAESLVRAAKGADKALIAGVSVFDVYQGDRLEAGKKSVAVCVTLQPTERTLTDDEIDAAGKKIVAAVKKATGGELRG